MRGPEGDPRSAFVRFAVGMEERLRDDLREDPGFAAAWEEAEVEGLISRLLDAAGDVFEEYVEDEPGAHRTERACARVGNLAMRIADAARRELEERG